MRKVVLQVANSLDNYIARKDDGIEWLFYSEDAGAILTEFWKNVDAVLYGRKTYEIGLGLDDPGGEATAMMAHARHYVFSRTLKTVAKNFELVSEDAGQFVRRLKEQPGKDICLMGGGDFARSLFEDDLVDEICVNIHPVLLGAGIPLFHELTHQVDLELVDCRTLEHGCVFATYRVKR